MSVIAKVGLPEKIGYGFGDMGTLANFRGIM